MDTHVRHPAGHPWTPVPLSHPVGHQGARVDITQRPAVAINGCRGPRAALCVALVVVLHGNGLTRVDLAPDPGLRAGRRVLGGRDAGPDLGDPVLRHLCRHRRRPGFWWVLPLTVRRRVSVRVRNFETNRLKVNDTDGNPVEIAAIVVWQVADTAGRRTPSTTTRTSSPSRPSPHCATSPPPIRTTTRTKTGTSLRGSTDIVAGELAPEVAERVSIAGVEIVEVRISHLAYAQEIAQAMLRRQQANAVVAARSRIVEGAVGMVEIALARLAEARGRGAGRGAEGEHGQQPDGGPVR